jgi:hypothetical protein
VVPPNGPVSVGTLLRREGRAAHSLDRPVVPRARDAADDDSRRSRRTAVTAGALLAVTAVLGTNVLGDLTRPPATKADEGSELGAGQGVVPAPAGAPAATHAADPLDQAVSALRTAGSPAGAATGGGGAVGVLPASGAGIVAQALRPVPPLVGSATRGAGAATAAVVPPLGRSTASSDRSTSAGSSSDRSSTDSSSSERSSTTRSSTSESSVRVTPVSSGGDDRDDASDTGTRRVRDTPSPSPRPFVPAFPAGEPAAAPEPAPTPAPDPAPVDSGTEAPATDEGVSPSPDDDADTPTEGGTPDTSTGSEDADASGRGGAVAPDSAASSDDSADASAEDSADESLGDTADAGAAIARVAADTAETDSDGTDSDGTNSADTDEATSTGRHAAVEDSSSTESSDGADTSDSSGDTTETAADDSDDSSAA